MKTTKFIIPVLAAALLAGSASAQIQIQVQPGNFIAAKRIAIPFPGGANNYYLLQQKPVKEDLKFTDAQAKKFDAAQKVQQAAQQEFFKSLRGGNRAEAQKKFKAANDTYVKTMKEILTKEQTTRLEQIQLQMQTRFNKYLLFYNKKYADKLEITAEQKTAYQKLQREQNDAMRALPRNATPQERSKAYAEIRDDTNKKMEKLLTKEQEKKLKDLLGKPYKGLNQPVRGGGVIRPLPAPIPGRPVRPAIPVKPVQPAKPIK